MSSFLRFHDLTKSYYEGDVRRVVLQNAHAEFQPGEITAILGKSGSGKSTLLNLISGIDAPDSGQIWVDGQDLTALSERDRTLFRRARVGFVFQFFNLIPTLTVGENVSLPLELNRIPRPDAHKKAQNLLETVGLLDRWKTFPEKLSGGEQQRVAIARAIAKRPDVMLCDEPTGALDAETGKIVLEALMTVNTDLGTTTVVITHNAPIARLAHRVLRMRSGRIVDTTVNATRARAADLEW